MKTEAALLAEIAAAPTLREQAALVGELDALRNSKTARVQADRDWDAAGTVVEQTLTPVLTHSFHTASTDWLSEADIPSVDANAVHAQASLWFGKTSSMVKADAEEFTEQAKGTARRLASQFGEQAGEAERLFMDYVAFLHRREAASGLDQIQQTVAPDGKTKKTTPLPTDTFDTFNDAIDPMNRGVDEMQSSDHAPLLQEILQEGSGEGQAEQAAAHGPGSGPSQNPNGGSGMQVGASLIDAPSVAQGYLYNLDDFLRSQAAIQQTAGRESADDSESSPSTGEDCPSCHGAGCKECGTSKEAAFGQYDRAPEEGHGEHCADCGSEGGYSRPESDCPDCGDRTDEMGLCPFCTPHSERSQWENEHLHNIRSQSSKQAASGLPQVQQVVDSQENPDPKPLPQDVAFPLIPYFSGPGKTLDAGYAERKQSVKIAASVEDMLAQVGTDNPMLGKTHDGSEKKVAEPTNAMEKATGKTAQAEYAKGAAFAANWKPGQPIVRQGSKAFEAGLYAGITANTSNQDAWLAEHERWGLGDRIDRHAAFTQAILTEAATTTDLDTMTPGMDLQKGKHTPLQGPGSVPPLAGGQDPAAPGGAAPYNGAQPFSQPVAPDPGWQRQQVKHSSLEERQAAFRQQAQAFLKAQAAANGPSTMDGKSQDEIDKMKFPVCRGCGEAFDSKETAHEAHGKRGCGTEDGERGYEMKSGKEAW